MATMDELNQAYKAAFKSQAGELILKDMAARFHMYSTTLAESPQEMAFREGQRSVLLFLNNTLQDRKVQESTIEE